MGKRLYVGNLPYRFSDTDLHQLFSAHGAVDSAQVVTDRETGRSKGFGFVEMASDADAQAAITALHDKDCDGRPLTVNEARPKEARPRDFGGGGGGFGGGGGGGGFRGGDRRGGDRRGGGGRY